MVFPHAAATAGAQVLSPVRPTALYRAASAYGAANRWTSVNGWAALEAYADQPEEESALRRGAGMCDFGLFARYRVSGPDAAAFLERLTTAPAERFEAGQSAPALLCDFQGFVVDFARVSRLDDQTYALVLSRPRERRLRAAAQGFDVTYTNITGQAAAIAVFGPMAEDAVSQLGAGLAGAASSVRHVEAGGVELSIAPIVVGDMPGLELVFAADEGLVVWERILRASPSVRPVGLAALDAARLEGREPRCGADFLSADEAARPGLKRTPFDLGLEGLAPLDGTWFNGRSALRRVAEEPRSRKLTLLAAVGAAAPGAQVASGGRLVGRITSSAYSTAYRQTLGFADLEAGAPDAGLEIQGVHGPLAARVV
ncbi:MAG: hypothetical protein AAGL49_07185 [Pseudomonadota bacterium]